MFARHVSALHFCAACPSVFSPQQEMNFAIHNTIWEKACGCGCVSRHRKTKPHCTAQTATLARYGVDSLEAGREKKRNLYISAYVREEVTPQDKACQKGSELVERQERQLQRVKYFLCNNTEKKLTEKKWIE
jgi:hypothetical protein